MTDTDDVDPAAFAPGQAARYAAVAVVVVGWLVAAFLTFLALIFVSFAVGRPECSTNDPTGQAVERVAGVLFAISVVTCWLTAIGALISPRWKRPGRRALVGVALPVALVAAWLVVAYTSSAIVDRVAETTD
ncbi:MAG TPA: hypothetical protein VF230_08575, partial [Acidimicrobiales bacterium]